MLSREIKFNHLLEQPYLLYKLDEPWIKKKIHCVNIVLSYCFVTFNNYLQKASQIIVLV